LKRRIDNIGTVRKEAAAWQKFWDNKKAISLVDALGYSCSRKLGIRFLTGDKEFFEMENVEYIK
jgi:predicted nucleic acid-binding protein